jgi:hypothetical protein
MAQCDANDPTQEAQFNHGVALVEELMAQLDGYAYANQLTEGPYLTLSRQLCQLHRQLPEIVLEAGLNGARRAGEGDFEDEVRKLGWHVRRPPIPAPGSALGLA